jgi:hypothetical protein
MSPIQQMLLGAGGAVATKTYVDDVFSTYLYKGAQGANTLNTGLNMSGDGGLVWIKSRSASNSQHLLTDTVRGANKILYSDATNAETNDTGLNQTFTSTGWTQSNGYTDANSGSHTYSSWNFRKASGFFTISSWTGDNDSNRAIPHDLKSIPGMIIVKNTSNSYDWSVWHRDVWNTTNHNSLRLNSSAAANTQNAFYDVSAPTSSNFYVRSNGANVSGQTYVAYVFAGGESTNTLARSVVLDGSGDYLQSGSSSDFTMGTGDFTVEGWFKKTNDADNDGLFQITTDSDGLSDHNSNSIALAAKSNGLNTYAAGSNQIEGGTPFMFGSQWAHVAMVRSSGVTKVYANGTERMSFTDTYNYNGTYLAIGGYAHTGLLLTGSVSNFRVVKGTAVYTSSFRPPTEPLTSISGTVLLCCNNSSVTGTTTGSISSNGDPTASSDSPFDDPAGFVFGENEDENVIKCGSFVASTDYDVWNNRVIELGWEPSFVMYKNASNTGNWEIFDNTRGFLATTDDSAMLEANTTDAEEAAQRITIEPTGFKERGVITTGDTVIYVAIRRPDGYVGKPPELGTDVFSLDAADGSTDPSFISNFPVDFSFYKQPASSDSWYTGARLIGTKYLKTDSSAAEATSSNFTWDYSDGWRTTGLSSAWQAWSWKRHAGMDVVAWTGDGVNGRQIPHSMNKTVEMIWLKKRTGTARNWPVYHKGLDGGSSPQEKVMFLNLTNAESDAVEPWNDTAPTSTHFTIGGGVNTNEDEEDYIAMLFASVDGISKVGSYTGNGSATERTITLGFQPRFLILKNANGGNNWFVFDTVRGWASGNDTVLSINSDAAQYSGEDYGAPTSNGFTLTSSLANVNENNSTYIYYAHA